ncbi:UDP-glycosyltransferase UGT5-like [Toxorhynchites rutilus septentrionalis]|uniref:UDP-glycosyltransferase UGT5-like n=1 Tax=Toxorhynchites rutilus septentrionalis TaxID=329112 RepID=UPI002478BD81|nr:UDP-glycosyltransferase UGT5-like [Toxorhynchites rutilus septentrionalis]
MNSRWVLAFLIVSLLTASECAKILGVLPVGRSHGIIGNAYIRTLTEAGHELTVITTEPLKNPPKNYSEILLTGTDEENEEEDENMFEFQNSGVLSSAIMLIMMYNEFADMICENVLQHPKVLKFLETEEHFDLVITESFLTESLYGFAQHFDAPLITISTFGSSMWTNELVGTPAPPSHVAHFMLSFTDHMTFWERLQNSAMYLLDHVYYHLLYLPKQKQSYDKTFPMAKQTFEQQMQNVSLVFLNQHFSLSFPRPYPPNMVEVGGIQVEGAKPLPEDLQKFLDEAPDGVIYFCMGSNIKSKHFPEEKREAFIRNFAKLKERVLWKFEDETIANLPPNLKIKSWMPQKDILAHPNVKLFITHGGLLSTTEALYFGKPMIGIPVFGDQMMNIRRSVRAGYAVLLEYQDINEATVHRAIHTVLSDPSYAKNAQLVSRSFRDKPMTPKETAAFWVEYVIRHKGAPQLRSPAMQLSFFQYHLLDVYAVVFLIMILTGAMVGFFVRKIYRKIFKPIKHVTRKKKRT